MHPSRRTFLRASAAVALSVTAAARAQSRPYTVAIVPQFAPAEIYARWRPLLDALSQRTHLKFTLQAYSTIPEFEEAFTKGVPDFAFLNPYHVVMAARSEGYIPLVHDARRLSGILVVRADAPIHAIGQLNGKPVAFPAPNAFGASLYMRALLLDQGVRVVPHYVGSHQNVYRSVARGDDVAGGGVAETLAREAPSLRAQLRVLYETPATAPHAFAANPRVPEAVRNAVRDAFLAMGHDPAAHAALFGAEIPQPVVADFARDYGPLEHLHLASLVVRPR